YFGSVRRSRCQEQRSDAGWERLFHRYSPLLCPAWRPGAGTPPRARQAPQPAEIDQVHRWTPAPEYYPCPPDVLASPPPRPQDCGFAVVCSVAAPVVRNSAAIPARNSFFRVIWHQSTVGGYRFSAYPRMIIRPPITMAEFVSEVDVSGNTRPFRN